jgi:hypothetical protein
MAIISKWQLGARDVYTAAREEEHPEIITFEKKKFFGLLF